MKDFIYINNLIKFSKKSGIKNILLQVGFCPYDIENKVHMLNFDIIEENLYSYIKKNFLLKTYSIVEFQQTNYLIQTKANFISIKELEVSKDTPKETELNKFIYGSKNYKILYQNKDLFSRHKKSYELINSIRELNDEPILIIETEKVFINQNSCNIINLFNPIIDADTFIRLINNIKFKFLIIPDLNDINLIKQILDSFYLKKVFISHEIDISFANFDETLILLKENKKASFNKIRFNESVFSKTINRHYL